MEIISGIASGNDE